MPWSVAAFPEPNCPHRYGGGLPDEWGAEQSDGGTDGASGRRLDTIRGFSTQHCNVSCNSASTRRACSTSPVLRTSPSGTVYRYFDDRQALVDATVIYNTENYYAEAVSAMSSYPKLVDQIGAFAEVFARNIGNYRRNWLVNDDRELLRLIAADRDGGLRRMSNFIAPYVEASRERGEISASVDSREAGEWIARMFMSLTVMPNSAAFDSGKPKSFRVFLERYVVDGLAPRSKAKRRKR